MNRRIERRTFLGHTATLVAGGIALPYFIRPSALGKAGSVAASERITIGMIGTGDHGRQMNLRSFLAQSDAHVIALCDVDRQQREIARKMVNDKYGNQDCAVDNDFREVLARTDIDAVMISTPDHWHVPISIAAAQAGKDVACEKPTLTVEEGRRLVETMKRYGRVFQWSTEDRAVDVYHRMCELVRNGRIGKVHTIKVELPSGPAQPGNPQPMPVPEGFDYDLWLGPAPWAPYTKDRCHWNFRWIFDYSGGMLTDWGAHLLDGAQWGNDTEHTGPVDVEGKGVFWREGLYDTAKEFHLEYTYADGVKLIVDSGTPSLRFEGTDGWIGNRGWRAPLRAEPASILNSVIGPDEIRLFTCPQGEQRNFLDCVKSRQDPYFPPEIGQRCFTIAHIGNIAMLLGKKLHWDPKTERFTNSDEANRMLGRAMRSPWNLL
jgi:myo-inositol 2-dehydrogenase / D-chiro-inositol 1-dehydrogenase